MLTARREITGRTYGERRRSYQRIHRDATLVDLQAHSSLKATWFGYNLAETHDKPSLLEKILDINPLGFNPLVVRTAFPKLIEGHVDVQVSTVYALEKDAVQKDMVTTIKPFGITASYYTLIKWLRWLPILKTAWQRALLPDYHEASLIAMNIIEQQVSGFPEIEFALTRPRLVELVNRNRLHPDRVVAMIHALEGAHCLEGPETLQIRQQQRDPRARSSDDNAIIQEEVLHNLDRFYERGVAIMGLAHYYPNETTESVFSYPERALENIPHDRWLDVWPDHTRGLTNLGREVINRMLTKGMIIDLSHVSPTARMEIYNMVDEDHGGKKGAVLASHIGLQAMYNHPYNLADWEIEWLADHDGVVGVILSNYWHTGREGVKLGLGHITDAIDHLVAVGGEKVVAFGSDFDGFSDPPDEVADATQWIRLTRHLFSQYRVEVSESSNGLIKREIVRKYGDDAIQKFLGANAYHTILQGWGKV
jgi:microsomal dipeptidase-like Zn-dependent dipeptidase